MFNVSLTVGAISPFWLLLTYGEPNRFGVVTRARGDAITDGKGANVTRGREFPKPGFENC
jgi:hypothetical protein